MKNFAHIILYNKKGKVCLQRRDRNKKIKHPNTIGFFGGSIKKGETPRKAVIRECYEETGYKLKDPVLLDRIKYPINKPEGYRYVFIEEYENKYPLKIKEGRGEKWLTKLDAERNKKILKIDKIILKKFYYSIKTGRIK